MSTFTEWVPFKVACRWHCLNQGGLAVGNSQQNRLNLQTLCVAEANAGANFAKWHLGKVNNTDPAQSLLVKPANVPGFVRPVAS